VQAELPIWIGGSSKAAIARTARFGTGWQAGRETPAEVAPVVESIAAAAAAAGRPIDEDHYGAGFPVRLGTEHDPGVKRAMEAWRKRTGQDPHDHFAVGDADTIMARITAYVEAGISKFILRPAGQGDADILDQTRRLIDEVLPQVAARWPKPRKAPRAASA
jgi:alkanesulfonate monooxygenase SsuD/methylene tetrahydromethanopterin reductase-like flavin-dependent oxidoreductase (luciferase family)